MSFVENPMFWPTLAKAVGNALSEKAQDIATAAQRNTAHPSIRRTIYADKARIDSQGPYAEVKMRRGLGPIYEKGAPNRRLKGRGKYPAGTSRGSITAEHFLQRALDSEVSKGLDLSRYL